MPRDGEPIVLTIGTALALLARAEQEWIDRGRLERDLIVCSPTDIRIMPEPEPLPALVEIPQLFPKMNRKERRAQKAQRRRLNR